MAAGRDWTFWRSWEGWLLVASAAGALVLGVAELAGAAISDSVGWLGVVAAPFVIAVAKFAANGLSAQRQHSLALERQNEGFERSLLVKHVASVFEEVIDLLNRVALREGRVFLAGQAALVQDVTNAAYRTLVYVRDDQLLNEIVEAFEASVRGERGRLVERINSVATRFREHLHGERQNSKASDADMTEYLRRLHVAMIGLRSESAIVPVKIRHNCPVTAWTDLRFSVSEIDEDLIGEAVVGGVLSPPKDGDLLLFYWHPREEAERAGAIGVAWASTTGGLRLAKRLTVARDRLIPFDTLDHFDPGLKGKLDQRRIPTDDYSTAAAVREIIERLHAQRGGTASRLSKTVPATFRNISVKDRTIRLWLDFNPFAEDPDADRLLEELVHRTSAGESLTVAFEGQDWQVTSFSPRQTHKAGDPFAHRLPDGHTASETDRSFVVFNLSPVDKAEARERENGWAPDAEAALTIENGMLRIEALVSEQATAPAG